MSKRDKIKLRFERLSRTDPELIGNFRVAALVGFHFLPHSVLRRTFGRKEDGNAYLYYRQKNPQTKKVREVYLGVEREVFAFFEEQADAAQRSVEQRIEELTMS